MTDKPFDTRIRELQAATAYHEFAYTPEEAMDEVVEIAHTLHTALTRIAYTNNYPKRETNDPNERNNQLRQWMQSVAADALTNYDRGTYRKLAHRDPIHRGIQPS